MANNFALPSHIRIRYVFLICILILIYSQLNYFTTLGTSLRSQPTTLESDPQASESSSGSSASLCQFETEDGVCLDESDGEPLVPSDSASEIDSFVDVLPDSAVHGSVAPIEDISTEAQSRVGKVTSLLHDESTSLTQAYEQALDTHKKHNENFGYKHFVQHHGAFGKIWSKHAYLIHILVQELDKPATERLQWLFWHDADVILLNTEMPLEVFLPPEGDRWAHINLLISNDVAGLNDGVFFVRVSEWSVYLLAATLSYPFYRPRIKLRLGEQTALEMVLQNQQYKNSTVHVPQEWFNAYHNQGHDESIPPEWNHKYHDVEPGDLLVHFSDSVNRVELMEGYLRKVGLTGTDKEKWHVPFADTKYAKIIPDWWGLDAVHEVTNQNVYWRHYHIIDEIGRKMDKEEEQYTKQLREKMSRNGVSAVDIEKAVKDHSPTFNKKKMNAFREEDARRMEEKNLDYIRPV